jgi:HK97 family phage portal protein
MAETGQQRSNRLWYSPEGFVLPDSAYYVTPELALTLSHVYCAVDIISGDFGTMTCQLFRDLGEDGKSKIRSSEAGIGRLAYQLRWAPNNWQTAKAFWSTLIWQYCLRPACYAEIIYRPGSDSLIEQLIPRHPDRVKQERLPSGRVRFRLTEPTGSFRWITQDEMLCVRNTSTDGLNALSRIQYGAKAIATALALQEFTRNYFEHGATAALIATYKGGTMEEQEESRYHARITRFLNGADNAGGIFLTPEDLEVKNLGVEPEKAQLLGLKNVSGRDVARMFKVPANWLAIEGAQSYNSSVQDTLYYSQRCQTPIVVEFEQAIQRDLLVAPDGYFAKFNMDYLMRATLKERMESYEIGIRARVIRPSEARQLEDMNADDELDQLSALDHRAGSQRDGADNKPKEARVPAAASVRSMLFAQDTAVIILQHERERVGNIARKYSTDVDGWKRELKAFYGDHAGVIAKRLRLPIDTARAVAARHGKALEDHGVLVMDEHWERVETEALVTLAMDPESSLTRLADVAQEIAS